MSRHWRYPFAALALTVALLALAACSTTSGTTAGGANPPAPTSSQPTATAAPTGCAALLPGATAATAIPGFTGYTLFPTGSVMTPLEPAYGGTGEYALQTTKICYPGTVAQVNGPYSGHSSIYATLLGMGLNFNSTFPYDGVTASDVCATYANCFNTNGLSNVEHYISFEHLTSPQSGFVTYQLRLATPPASPSCSPPSDYSSQAIIHTWKITNSLTYTLPPLTKGSSTNTGSGYAGGNLYWLCSAGTGATILQYMKNVAQSQGETLMNSSSTSFEVCLEQTAGQYYSITITTSTGDVWEWDQTVPAFSDPTC